MAVRLALLAVILSVCSACGGGAGGEINDPRINLENVPEFRELSSFPGYISGFERSLSGLFLNDSLPCLNIENAFVVQDSTIEALSIDGLDVTDDLVVVEGDTHKSYCFNPIWREGVYNIDITLRSSRGLEFYQFEFTNNRRPPFPLSEFPGEIDGLLLGEDNMRVLDAPLCVVVSSTMTSAINAETVVRFAFDGRSVVANRLSDSRLAEDRRQVCVDEIDLAPGRYTLEIQLVTSPGFPPATESYQGEIVVVE